MLEKRGMEETDELIWQERGEKSPFMLEMRSSFYLFWGEKKEVTQLKEEKRGPRGRCFNSLSSKRGGRKKDRC